MILFLVLEQMIHYENKFIHVFRNMSLRKFIKYDLTFNSYYFGSSNGKIYLELHSPLQVLNLTPLKI
jgi:hypothetical protein